jgi:hypothetical protein
MIPMGWDHIQAAKRHFQIFFRLGRRPFRAAPPRSERKISQTKGKFRERNKNASFASSQTLENIEPRNWRFRGFVRFQGVARRSASRRLPRSAIAAAPLGHDLARDAEPREAIWKARTALRRLAVHRGVSATVDRLRVR